MKKELSSQKVAESKLCLVNEALIRDLLESVSSEIPDIKSHNAASRSSTKFRDDRIFQEAFSRKVPGAKGYSC